MIEYFDFSMQVLSMFSLRIDIRKVRIEGEGEFRFRQECGREGREGF